jgi:hypothetical protein
MEYNVKKNLILNTNQCTRFRFFELSDNSKGKQIDYVLEIGMTLKKHFRTIRIGIIKSLEPLD